MLPTDLLDRLDDPDAFLVYADHLQSQGDPRGELITVQHALAEVALHLEALRWSHRGLDDVAEAEEHREDRVLHELQQREAALLEDHKEALLGPMTHYEDLLEASWSFGFMYSAHVHFQRTDPVKVVDAFLECPSAVLIRELRLGIPVLLTDFSGVLARLAGNADAKSLLAMRRLLIGHPGSHPYRVDPAHAPAPVIGNTAALNAFPELRRLAIFGKQIDLGGIDLPELRELELHSLSPEFVKPTFHASWPKLSRLTLSFPFVEPEDLGPLFNAPGMLALEHLVITPGLSDEWTEALLESPLLKQLKTLKLDGPLTEGAMNALAASPEKLAHLKKLEVDRGGLSWESWEVFRQLVVKMIEIQEAA